MENIQRYREGSPRMGGDHCLAAHLGETTYECNGQDPCLVCRLRHADTQIAALRQRQLEMEALIAAFVVPHEALDNEATPGEQYDELMASWQLALAELQAYYHDHILGTGAAIEADSNEGEK